MNTRRYKKILQFFSLGIIAIVMSGCSFVRIQNASDVLVTVLVRVPDSSRGYTRTIRPEHATDVFTSHGGRYTVTMLPNEDYQETLESLRAMANRRLFEEGASLSGEEVEQLVAMLDEIDTDLEDLALPGASCNGSVPDFETSVATIVWDEMNTQWTLSCQ